MGLTRDIRRSDVEELRSHNCVFTSDTGAPARARAWLESLEMDLSDEVKLLTHELVVNALTHTSTDRIWVVVLASPTVIRVQVSNEGRTDPHIESPDPFAEGGRGLKWVDRLSERWDHERTSATHVWFQVPRDKGRSSAEK